MELYVFHMCILKNFGLGYFTFCTCHLQTTLLGYRLQSFAHVLFKTACTMASVTAPDVQSHEFMSSDVPEIQTALVCTSAS